LNLEPTDCLLAIDSKWFQRLPDWLSRQFEPVLGSVVSKDASKKFCPPADQARCQVWSLRTSSAAWISRNVPLLSLQTGQEPRIATLRAVVVYRARGKKLVVVIGQKKAHHAQGTEAALIVVEGDAPGQPGYFIGRGLAFRKCGVHGSESFLPWESARGRAHQEADSTRIWLRGEVCVG